MASPLILKPLVLNDGQALALIVRLKTPALSGLEFRTGNRPKSLREPPLIRDPSLAKYQNSPLQYAKSGSALDAFLAWAKSTQHFQEEGL